MTEFNTGAQAMIEAVLGLTQVEINQNPNSSLERLKAKFGVLKRLADQNRFPPSEPVVTSQIHTAELERDI